MGSKKNNFWLDDDPEWAALRDKQKQPSKKKLSRALRKKSRTTQLPAEPMSQFTPQDVRTQTPTPAAPTLASTADEKASRNRAHAYMTSVRPSARYRLPSISRGDSTTRKHTPPDTTKRVNISLNLTVPRINLKKLSTKVSSAYNRRVPLGLKRRLASLHQQRSRKQLLASFAVISVLIIGLVGGVTMLTRNPKGNNEATGVLAEKTVKPDFKPVLPNGKVSNTNSGNVAYDAQKRVASFTDRIGSVDITVSQQLLPEQFKTDTDARVEKMAKDLYATEVINASNPKAYLGNSIKGPQTVIFTKNGLLVFIQSPSKLDKDQWSDYVTRLIQ